MFEGPISGGKIFDVELHAASLELGQKVFWRKFLRC